MVYFKDRYNFPRFKRGFNIFSRVGGGPTFSRGGGSNCLFPIESHITCVLPGESGPPAPPPPLDQCMQYFAVKKVSYEKNLSILTPPPPLPWVFLNVYMVSGKTSIVTWPGSKLFLNFLMGAQWLSGRVLDSRWFGPRSGPTFCSGLIGVQTVCKDYQQMTMWSWTDVFYFCAILSGPDRGPNCLTL